MMKMLFLISLVFVGSLSLQGQQCYDLNSPEARKLADSLNTIYSDTDKDTASRKILFNYPLFYDLAFQEFFDSMYKDIKDKKIELNIETIHINYYVSENGNLDFIIYDLDPYEKKKIQLSDHRYIKDFVSKHHTIDLISKKKYRHNDNLMLSPITKIIINK